MGIFLSTVFAVLPSIIILRYFYRRDFHPEPRHVLLRTFLLGVATIVPAGAIGVLWMITAPLAGNPILAAAGTAFFAAAIPEEFFKFLVVARYSARHPAFNEPMDGIIYGVTASLGFATLENMLYVYSHGWGVAVLRAFTSVPAHACFGALMGYFIAQARLHPTVRTFGWMGYFAATILHGLYNFPLFVIANLAKLPREVSERSGNVLLAVAMFGLFLAVLVLSVIWTALTVRRMNRHQRATAPPPLPVFNR